MTDHDGTHADCPACARIKSRRAVIMTRALHAPGGLPPHRYTQGMAKADALQFWVDARALGMISVGLTKRGAKLFALPSYEAPSLRGRVKP